MNITNEQYIEAKNIVKQYEINNIKHIGIICLNRQDFFNFVSENNLDMNDDLITYHKISNINDLCSLTLDECLETRLAKHNHFYNEIIENIKINLKK